MKKGKQWRRRNENAKRPAGRCCHSSTLPFALVPALRGARGYGSAELRGRQSNCPAAAAAAGGKPWATGFRVSVFLPSRDPHLPRLRWSRERLEMAHTIQLSVSLSIPRAGVRYRSRGSSCQRGRGSSFFSNRRATWRERKELLHRRACATPPRPLRVSLRHLAGQNHFPARAQGSALPFFDRSSTPHKPLPS